MTLSDLVTPQSENRAGEALLPASAAAHSHVPQRSPNRQMAGTSPLAGFGLGPGDSGGGQYAGRPGPTRKTKGGAVVKQHHP